MCPRYKGRRVVFWHLHSFGGLRRNHIMKQSGDGYGDVGRGLKSRRVPASLAILLRQLATSDSSEAGRPQVFRGAAVTATAWRRAAAPPQLASRSGTPTTSPTDAL